MATPCSTPTPSKLLHIDAIQTVTPAKMAEPGRSRRISVAAPLGPEILQSRLRVVLYYEKAASQESPSVLAAWIKESLNAALSDEPVFAGRLRRDSEGDGWWEIKFNDSGVRLVHASAEMTMSEFLGSEGRNGREAELASWVDVDEEDPRSSPLFYIQVTQFLDDGYSIGISCGVLLADPLFLGRFLKSWVQTHAQMLAHGQLSERSLFHLNYFQRPDRPHRIRSTPLDSTPANPSTTTTTTTKLFKVARPQGQGSPPYNELANLCLNEVKQRIEGKAMAMSNFSLIINDHAGDLKVESCNTKGLAQSKMSFNGAFGVVWWKELGIEDIALSEGNRPIHASYHVVSSADEPLVMVMLPSDSSDLFISTTIPK